MWSATTDTLKSAGYASVRLLLNLFLTSLYDSASKVCDSGCSRRLAISSAQCPSCSENRSAFRCSMNTGLQSRRSMRRRTRRCTWRLTEERQSAVGHFHATWVSEKAVRRPTECPRTKATHVGVHAAVCATRLNVATISCRFQTKPSLTTPDRFQ